MTSASNDGSGANIALFDLPEELAIDTAVAQRVIEGFIRGQLRQAGFERAVLALSGGIDSALVAYLVAAAIGADKLLCVLMPYRTSSPASRADAESVVADLGCASELVDISAMVDGYFGTGTTPGEIRTRPAMMLKNPSPSPNWTDGLRIVQSRPESRTSASAFAFELA